MMGEAQRLGLMGLVKVGYSSRRNNLDCGRYTAPIERVRLGECEGHVLRKAGDTAQSSPCSE